MRRSSQAAFRLLGSCWRHQFGLRYQSGHVATSYSAISETLSSSSVTATASICRPGNSGRAVILDGRAVAAAWEKELLADVQLLTGLLGRPPGMGVVLVGSRPDSMLYVTKKQEACQKAGMQTFVHHLPDSVSQAQLEAAVSHVCADCRVDGVLIQLPLPRHLSEEAVMEVLDPRKDVDGFHPLNMGRMLMRGRGVRLVPATPLGCIELLRRSGVDVQGKTCVVLGDSNTVGTPLAAMLRDRGAAAVTVCHRRSYREWFEDQELVQRKRAAAAVCLPHLPGPSPPPPRTGPGALGGAEGGDEGGSGGGEGPGSSLTGSGSSFQSYQLPDLTRSADILVVAVGHPELVRGDWVRPGAVVIDVGINVVSALPRTRPQTAPASVQPQPATTTTTPLAPSSPPRPASDPKTTASPHASPAAGDWTAVTTPDAVGRGNGGDGSDVGGGAGDDGGGGDNGVASNGSLYGRNLTFHVVGDVAFDEVLQVAGAITPVPGGVGPMTIAAVLHNTIKAAKYRAGLEPW